MNQPDDDELHAAFDQLRDDDHTYSPPPEFRTVWGRAEGRAGTIRRARPTAAFWIAAAAGIVLTLGVALGRSHHRDASVGLSAVPSISNWTSPTASLLNTSGRALLAPPPILSSILDGAASPPVQRKGD